MGRIHAPENGAKTGRGGSVTVAVLFARSDSVYKTLPDCDVFDIDRDARTFAGGCQVIAHPPCRAWGRLRAFAKPRPDEKELARFAVQKVRECGGVLEHPEHSSLWPDMALPIGKERDSFGGFTLSVDQFWFGHKAKKGTFLYVVGCEPGEIPPFSLRFENPQFVVASRKKGRKEITKAEREATPEGFAVWLLELAKKCKPYPQPLN